MNSRTALPIVAVVLALSLAFRPLPGADVERPHASALSSLKVGQHVSLKECGGNLEVRTFDAGELPLGHEVIEVHDDFLVLKDFAGITETRIPLTSIRAVVHQKFMVKK